MSVKVSYDHLGNYIAIKTYWTDPMEIAAIDAFYLDILFSLFGGREVKLVTIDPQEMSWCYELNNGYQIESNLGLAYVNEINNFPSDLLRNAYESEDFRRGFLYFTKEEDPVAESLYAFREFQMRLASRIEKVVDYLAFFNFDGDVFYLFNSRITLEELREREKIFIKVI